MNCKTAILSCAAMLLYCSCEQSNRYITPEALTTRPHLFSEGKAAVCQDGKWGFINREGEWLVPCQYDSVGDFSEGYAAVFSGGLCGLIDTTAQLVIPMQEYALAACHDGISVGRKVVSRRFDTDIYTTVIEYGFTLYNVADSTAQAVGYDEVCNFCEGRARVSKDGKWGYIDRQGNEVIACTYRMADDFSDGLAAVSQKGGMGYESIYCYIDTTGAVKLGEKYSVAAPFHEGRAFVVAPKAKGWNYESNLYVIDKDGDTVYDPELKDCSIHLIDKTCLLASSQLVTLDGVCLEQINVSHASAFSDGKALVSSHHIMRLIDKQGHTVLDNVSLEGHSSYADGMILTTARGLYVYKNAKGEIVIPRNFNAEQYPDTTTIVAQKLVADSSMIVLSIDRLSDEVYISPDNYDRIQFDADIENNVIFGTIDDVTYRGYMDKDTHEICLFYEDKQVFSGYLYDNYTQDYMFQNDLSEFASLDHYLVGNFMGHPLTLCHVDYGMEGLWERFN